MRKDRNLAHLHPILRPLCAEFFRRCEAEGIPAFLDVGYRTAKDQAALYAIGRNGDPRPVVTNARPGQSLHNFTINGTPASKAFDIAVKNSSGKGLNWSLSHPHWQRAGQIGKELGLVWGGDWKKRDGPHFELSSPPQTQET